MCIPPTLHPLNQVESGTCDTEFAHNVAFKILTALVNFYIPMAVMLFLYSRIFAEILKRSENVDLGQCMIIM